MRNVASFLRSDHVKANPRYPQFLHLSKALRNFRFLWCPSWKISPRQGKEKAVHFIIVLSSVFAHANFEAIFQLVFSLQGVQASPYHCNNWDCYFKLLEMRTQMNLRSLCCLFVTAVIGITIACAELEPTVRLTRSEEATGSDIQLKRYADFVKNYYYMFGKAR